MKKLLKLVLVLGAVGTLTACQTTQMEKVAQTPSGLPDVTFNQSKTVVQNKISKLCLDNGWYVSDQSDNHVLCEGRLDPAQDVLITAFLKPAYATETELPVRFQTSAYNGQTRVVAKQWVQWQNAFGQETRHVMNSVEQFNSIQSKLYSIGGI